MDRQNKSSHRLCIAPMLNRTDRHYRYLARLLTKHSLLYTEMITTGALLHHDHRRRLKFDPCEHPVALQLGGSCPDEMAQCAEYATEYGYDEINLNVGCPSNRVQAGKFGACLMLEPRTVAHCVKAIRAATHIEVSVKTRLGVDNHDSYQNLHHFVETVASEGCMTFIIHARKAFLKGLSPKENRTVPPLCYEFVYRLKQDFQDLEIILNGGIHTRAAVLEHLGKVDGVMIGRKAYEDPYFMAEVDTMLFDSGSNSRHEALKKYIRYMCQQQHEGVPLSTLTRHLSGLFHGMPGARAWRKCLLSNAGKNGAGIEAVYRAESLLAHHR